MDTTEPSPIAGRHVFYNNSYLDGNDPTPGAADDEAVAPDKTALLAGQTATFANYTSFTGGINGVMVDFGDLPESSELTAADFEFRVSNGDPPSQALAPAPDSVTVRRGAGSDGADRITIIWPDGAIRNTWLQVTVKAGPHTGLTDDDVFCFGNAVGESGLVDGNTFVNISDELDARNHATGFSQIAAVDNAFDYNRDGRVDVADELIARNHASPFLGNLTLIMAQVLTFPRAEMEGAPMRVDQSLACEVVEPAPPSRPLDGRALAVVFQSPARTGRRIDPLAKTDGAAVDRIVSAESPLPDLLSIELRQDWFSGALGR